VSGVSPRAHEPAVEAGTRRVAASMGAWPAFAPDERAAVAAVLASGMVNYWTGREARLFEKEYAAHLGVGHAIALMNGTVALELALKMWGIGAGDDVIVSPRSFIASTSCAVLQGARPVFADVDSNSGNITAQTVERALTPLTRAIIPVHLAGWPCDMDPIMSLAEQHGIRVLEDCAQAHGARYKGALVGSIGHAAAFSFCQDKILTTGGEGGLLATRDETLWEKAWSFKDHGKTWNAVYERQHGPGFRWVHDRFGTNWRMTEMQAAIGRVQLNKAAAWVETRRRHAGILTERLGRLTALRVVIPPADVYHSYYRLYVYVRPEALKSGWTRDRLLSVMAERGVACFAGSCSEIYRERAFEGTNWSPAQPLPTARMLGETCLAFLVHPTLSEMYLNQLCDVAEDVITQATA
jgi:dTDP-4-amino-4,6-dideoxygalactose transaminase